MFDPYTLIGLSLADADVLAKTNGFVVRVTTRDDESLIGTSDYRVDRVNVGVNGEVITSIAGIG